MNENLVKSRKFFHMKTHEEPMKFRHLIVPKGNLVHKHSCLNHPDASMEIESELISNLLTVTDCRIPIPPTSYRESDVDTFQIMKQARGTNLSLLNVASRYQVYQNLATHLLNLHKIKGDGMGPLISANPLTGVFSRWNEYLSTDLKQHLDYLLKHDLISNETTRYVFDAITNFEDTCFPEASSLLHGDLNDHNIFCDHGVISDIIDWEDALIGDPVFELASWATFHPVEEHNFLIDEYYRVDARPGDFNLRFWTYFLRVSICKMVILHQRGFLNLNRAQDRIELAKEKLNA